MRRSAGLLAVVALAALWAGGCSTAGGGAAGGAGGNGGGAAGGAPGACGVSIGDTYGDTCNGLTATACATPVMSTAPTPVPAGGSLANGTYDLSGITIYGTTDANVGFNAQRGALAVADATASSATLDLVDVFGSITQRAHGTTVVAGANLAFTASCPSPDAGQDASGSVTFTATSTTITLFRIRFGLTLASLYTKRP
ncbi:MAG TPA: hypothetical protein VKZ18_04850 [Polyangia bacterium]|nr:hypothetical protein [Polyangia bacterium]